MGKYTSLARTLRDEPEGANFGKEKGSTQKNTYVNINNNDKRIDSNPPPPAGGSLTTLRPTTLTTLIAGEDEKRDVPCIHGTPQDACAVCSGYARWLAADGERLRRAQADPEAVRREFWREVPV